MTNTTPGLTPAAQRLLNLITDQSPMSTADVAATTNFSADYANRILGELADTGLIIKTAERRDRGRPINMWTAATAPHKTGSGS